MLEARLNAEMINRGAAQRRENKRWLGAGGQRQERRCMAPAARGGHCPRTHAPSGRKNCPERTGLLLGTERHWSHCGSAKGSPGISPRRSIACAGLRWWWRKPLQPSKGSQPSQPAVASNSGRPEFSLLLLQGFGGKVSAEHPSTYLGKRDVTA